MSDFTQSVISPNDYPARKPRREESSSSASNTAVATVSSSSDETAVADVTIDPREARRKLGWQDKYQPPVEVAPDFRKFMNLRTELERTVARLDEFVAGDVVSDDVAPVVAEIEAILDEFYKCQYGEGESLKQFVLAVLGQIRNSQIAVRHCEFLKDASQFLASQQLIDESAVDWAMENVETHGLEMFRGTLTETSTLKKFKVVEVVEDAG